MASLDIVRPITTGRSYLPATALNLGSSSIERMDTMLGFSLATSMPIALVPVSVTTLTPLAASDLAISLSSLIICATRTPGAGTTSYRVTVGPTLAEIFEILIL